MEMTFKAFLADERGIMVCSASQRIDGVELSGQRAIRKGLREQGVCRRYELEILAGTENGSRGFNTIYTGFATNLI